MGLNIIIGGKAGQGPNFITHMLAEALVKRGYYVFYSRDYQSLIRGGHNFNQISICESEMFSNEQKIDILVALDDETVRLHKKELKKKNIILRGSSENAFYLGALFKILGLDYDFLNAQLKHVSNYEDNLKNAQLGFDKEKKKYDFKQLKKINYNFMNGSQGIVFGAIASGMDLYFAYPMTPATPILFELGGLQEKNNFMSLELESEIAVINAALGSSLTGAKTMVGSSGGGYDLMTETLSEAGQAEVPLVIYLASRPGPSTGLATHTSQGDLDLALYSGHGEFTRVVSAPGDPVESQELVSQAFYLSQKYKIPCIVLSDKHLAESCYTTNLEPVITKSEKSTSLMRYNSYEHTATGEATENAELVKKNFERRMEKARELKKEVSKMTCYKIFGKKSSRNLILGWGSTKGAIIDAIQDLDAKFLQVLYMEPWDEKICQELKDSKKIILVENSSTGQLGRLVAEKCLIKIEDKNKILKYTGRPFFSDELREEIKSRL